jgi:hypothetical protein
MQDAAGRVGAIVRGLRSEEGVSPEGTQREAALLEWLVTTYESQRSFSAPGEGGEPSADEFRDLFSALLASRFADDGWWSHAPEANKLLVLQTLRLLMRDGALQEQWALEPGATSAFVTRLHHYADAHAASASGEFNLEIVGELAAMAKRLVRRRRRMQPAQQRR